MANLPLDELLKDYTSFDEVEAAMVAQLQNFLAALLEPQAVFERELAGAAPNWGHVTGSAWVIDSDAANVLMVHHAKLGIWVQPGGHCDGESDVLAVACREAREETGLNVAPVKPDIFDVDVHLIPEYWNTPTHFHYDVRFLLRADAQVAPIINAESRAAHWATLDEAAELNPCPSITRMIAKTRLLINEG